MTQEEIRIYVADYIDKKGVKKYKFAEDVLGHGPQALTYKLNPEHHLRFTKKDIKKLQEEGIIPSSE